MIGFLKAMKQLSTLAALPKITLISNKVIVSLFKEIVTLSDTLIKIKLDHQYLLIKGTALMVEQIEQERLVISGQIEMLSFVKE